MSPNYHRRRFLQMGMKASLSSFLLPYTQFLPTKKRTKITILHTNDVHSRLDPFPLDAGRLAGKGGAARRKAYIDLVRQREEYVIVLDAGDIWQGTPYFSIYQGQLEFEAMSKMGYDAATLGNHDFDLGLEGLKAQWKRAKFPFVCTNYDFSHTILAGRTTPYHILQKGPVRIGLLGLGIKLTGLVPDPLYGATKYLDPMPLADDYARMLKKEKDCDFVIVLSHLGLAYSNATLPSDVKLAQQSRWIDLVIGGHTHTFLPEPRIVRNAKGEGVAINQVGYGGAMIGHIELIFGGKERGAKLSCQNCWVNSK